jgi:hypothetical protein
MRRLVCLGCAVLLLACVGLTGCEKKIVPPTQTVPTQSETSQVMAPEIRVPGPGPGGTQATKP